MNRRLAGTRRNKHLPIARRTRRNDRLPQLCEERSARHRRFAADEDRYDPEAAAVWRAVAALFHDPAQGSKPDHAARAVDITTIWPPVTGPGRDSARQAAEAGARGRSAQPMSYGRRTAVYDAQNGLAVDPETKQMRGRRWTSRQFRQVNRMEIRARLATA